MNTPSNSWWRIDVRSSEADEGAWLAAELGAGGAQFIDDERFSSFVDGPEVLAKEIAAELAQAGHQVLAILPVENENWVQRCEAVWQPVRAGRFTITPLVSASARQHPPREDELFVIPGMGFGTGHHESTRLALKLLEHPEVQSLSPKEVLDLGTGNGMLSFAASLSFGCNIDARDLDANALANATENLTLNPGCKKITFRQGTLTASDPEGQFCLIMANIYAEVLVPLAPIFRRSLRQQGLLILSGVFDETIELVLHGFEKDFELVARLDENEWSGLLYRAA